MSLLTGDLYLFGLLFSFYNVPYQSTWIVDCKGHTECFTLALILSLRFEEFKRKIILILYLM